VNRPFSVRPPSAPAVRLRHAALTTWLNAGIAPAEVSKRAGNTVEVLLRRYAGCIDNQADSINRRIEHALDDAGLEIEPGA
jgi:hypothetical protein